MTDYLDLLVARIAPRGDLVRSRPRFRFEPGAGEGAGGGASGPDDVLDAEEGAPFPGVSPGGVDTDVQDAIPSRRRAPGSGSVDGNAKVLETGMEGEAPRPPRKDPGVAVTGARVREAAPTGPGGAPGRRAVAAIAPRKGEGGPEGAAVAAAPAGSASGQEAPARGQHSVGSRALPAGGKGEADGVVLPGAVARPREPHRGAPSTLPPVSIRGGSPVEEGAAPRVLLPGQNALVPRPGEGPPLPLPPVDSPSITVRIGRVEVAQPRPAERPRPAAPPPPRVPALGLDEYLRRREGRGR